MLYIDYGLSYILSIIIFHFIYFYYFLTFMLNTYKDVKYQNQTTINIFIDTIQFNTHSVHSIPFNQTM